MKLILMSLIIFIFLFGCDSTSNHPERKYSWETIKVTATAYNSTKSQTDKNPGIGAFGDSLKPGMKYIAVSRDLFRKGLKHNTPVQIEGFKGLYLVKDRMPYQWKNRIDIYMGTDVEAAREWGRQKVIINYRIEIKESNKISKTN